VDSLIHGLVKIEKKVTYEKSIIRRI
jgi:hypothetical protein